MRKLYFSASQKETIDLCWRKWFFSHVLKLPVLDKGYRTLGTVLHAVIERYLNGDQTGRDADGNVIELYPPGWDSVKDEKTGIVSSVTEEEKELIQGLVTEAIKKGVINRDVKYETEEKVEESLGALNDVFEGVFTGYIDLVYEHGIKDNKTTKSTRYVKSEEDLKRNPQALLYSYFWFKKKNWERDKCRVTFNYFIKEPPPRVVQVSIDISREMCWNAWQEMIGTAKQAAHIASTVENFEHLPWPPDSACKAFGGCDFWDICSKQTDVETYRRRISTTIDNKVREQNGQELIHLPQRNVTSMNFNPPPPPPVTGNLPFGRLDLSGLPIQPKPEKIEKPAPPPPPAPPNKVSDPIQTLHPAQPSSPPWANPSCAACGGAGLASNGAPCHPCDRLSWETQKLYSGMYVTEQDPYGNLYWNLKPEFRPQPAPPPTPQPVSRAMPQPAPQPVPQEEAEGTPEESFEESSDSLPDAVNIEGDISDLFTKSPGKPSKGFILCINCVVTKSHLLDTRDRKLVHLDQLIEHLGSKLAADAKIESFWLLDSFKRRDLLKYLLIQSSEDLTTREAIVIARNSTPEERESITVLRGYAKMVFEGVS